MRKADAGIQPSRPPVGAVLRAWGESPLATPGAGPSVGVVSRARGRSESRGVFDANILLEGEMCGGPLVDRSGRIVGISTRRPGVGQVPIFSVTAARKLAAELTGAVSD